MLQQHFICEHYHNVHTQREGGRMGIKQNVSKILSEGKFFPLLEGLEAS